MNVQEQIKVLKEQISSSQELLTKLEDQIKKEQEFPKVGDEYWRIDDKGSVDNSLYNDYYTDNHRQAIGNFFQTKQQAEFTVEKLKVEAELRKYSRPFKEGENENWFILWGTYKKEVQIDWSRKLVRQGTIYFESRKKANEAVESVGEERIKKYIFGVEE